MKTKPPREIAVFIASPGDLAPERKAFKDVIELLNAGFADGAGVKFVPLGWEDVLSETGRRPQSVINLEIERCDFFILALHRRWGQKAPDSPRSSYTEEEYYVALERWTEKKSPEIAVFFKNVDAASLADPGKELKKVMAFRKKLESDRRTMIRRFSSELEFSAELDRHLRAFARNEWEKLDQASGAVSIPRENIDALDQSGRDSAKRAEHAASQQKSAKRGGKKASPNKPQKPDLSLVQAEQVTLALARAAVDAAGKNNIEDATVLFAQATEGTNNLAVLSVAAEFFRQMGDSSSSERLIRRQAAIARDRAIAARYYLSLIPKGFSDVLLEQISAQMLSQFPEEMRGEMREIIIEAFGNGRLDRITLDTMVKYYSTEEILVLAQFMATPEAQSTVRKQPLILKEMIEFGQTETLRLLRARHPEMFAEEPKTIAGTDSSPKTLQDSSTIPPPLILQDIPRQ